MRIEFLKNTTQDGKNFKKGQQLGVTLYWGGELIKKGVAFDVNNPPKKEATKTKKIEENGD